MVVVVVVVVSVCVVSCFHIFIIGLLLSSLFLCFQELLVRTATDSGKSCIYFDFVEAVVIPVHGAVIAHCSLLVSVRCSLSQGWLVSVR